MRGRRSKKRRVYVGRILLQRSTRVNRFDRGIEEMERPWFEASPGVVVNRLLCERPDQRGRSPAKTGGRRLGSSVASGPAGLLSPLLLSAALENVLPFTVMSSIRW